ncbi:response regulator transcription factor [Ideonella azotifigens]|uniref:Response regulator transcription factor n=1 Tax=Ideonella azotifigens TaxID=513160 RepID=A0ABP3V8B3_9BURK|nr:response regulator transcription factor [Ideonella azotifigens]MCD2341400.1 response regulator transcription factor [Ideonella azotifigens]
MNAAAIRLLAVDDHPLMRQGIASLIMSQPDMRLVAEAADGDEALQQYRNHRPDVVLMDVQMPGSDGIEAIETIVADDPGARIVVLTTYEGDVQALRALKAGARGYLLKNMVRKELLDAIREVHAGKRHIPTAVAAMMGLHSYGEALSPRELQVLRQLKQGGTNRQIADALCLSEDTVKTHMKSILSKLGATDRTQAVVIALQRGFISIVDTPSGPPGRR